MSLMIDVTTHEIYGFADRDQINSWLRTLYVIRQLPERKGGKP